MILHALFSLLATSAGFALGCWYERGRWQHWRRFVLLQEPPGTWDPKKTLAGVRLEDVEACRTGVFKEDGVTRH